jgi:F-type H+-transporting ATPase subunit epsilon
MSAAANSFRLRVYTPEHELIDTLVREVTVEGADGQIGVLPDHAALVTVLEPGVLTYREADGRVVRLQLGGGFAEVRDNVMTVLADSGEPLAA